MFCKNCGAYNDDNSVFCTKCGAPTKSENVQAEANEAVTQPLYEQNTVNQNTFEQTANEQSYQQGADAGFQQFPGYDANFQNDTKKKKGGKKALKGIIIAVVVLIVLGIVGLFSWTSIAKAAVGDVSFYLWREYDNVVELLDTDVFENLSHTQTFTSDSDVKVNVDGDDYSGNVNMSYDKDKHTTTATVNIDADGEKIPVTVNYCEGRLSFESEELLGGANVYLDINDIESFTATTGSGEGVDFSDADIKGTILDEDVREKVIAALPSIIKKAEKEALNDGQVKTKVGFVNKKPCTVVTLELTNEDLAKFVEALWEACKDNDDVMDAFKNTVDLVSLISGGEIETDELIDSIDEGVDEMVEYADDDYTYNVSIAYSFTGEIVNRTIDFEIDSENDGTLSIDSDLKGNNKKLSVKLDTDYSANFSFDYNVSTKGNKLNGDISLELGDNTTYSAELKDIGVAKCNGVYVPVGDLDVAYKYSYDSYSEAFNLSVSGEASSDYVISAKANYDGEEMFSGSINTELEDKSNLDDYSEPKKNDDSISIIDFYNNIYGYGNMYDEPYEDYYDDYYDDYDYDYDYDYSDYGYSDYGYYDDYM